MTISSEPVSTHNSDIDATEYADAGPVDEEEEQQAAGEQRQAGDHEVVRDEGDDHRAEEEEGDAPRCLPCPGSPSRADRLAHEVSHWPYRPWCEWCVRGRAVGPNSKTVPLEKKESIIPKTHLDYAFLQDEIVEIDTELDKDESVNMSMTMMVMTETLCDSVWTYATRGKGYASDPWLPRK